MKTRFGAATKLLLLTAAIGLIAVLYTPIWRIDLDAPQYPEGLSLSIHANGLRGNVDIINGLNHYIGMKTLHNEDFFEFRILPYIIVFFAGLFLITLVAGRRWLLNISFTLFVLFGILAMYDFWKWEYDYGHNLNPDAAIIVPGMAYQPPLIGFKQLLNFGAYSVPDTGGWIFITAGALLLVAVVLEWRKASLAGRYKVIAPSLLVLLCAFLQGCSTGPQSINPGKDECSYCKMSISDIKYAAEAITAKGKVYKFDDISCLTSFINKKSAGSETLKDIYLSDFAGTHTLVKAEQCFLLHGGNIHGPMNGDVIAFSNKDSLQKAAVSLHAEETTWQWITK